MHLFITIILALNFNIAFAFEKTSIALQKDSPSFINSHNQSDNFKNLALYSILAQRCSLYFPSKYIDDCKFAIEKQIKLLDFDVLFSDDFLPEETIDIWSPKSYTFVAFKTDLIKMLNEKKTTEFLNDLIIGLNKYLLGEDESFNLWDYALKHYETPTKALRSLAVLFQDTSPPKLHLAYLNKAGIRGRAHFESNKLLLERVIDTFSMVFSYSGNKYLNLFYPSSLQQHFNKNIYHFYVQAHLSLSLKNSGLQEKYAFAAPFILTLTYEFVTMSEDFRYLYKDPLKLDAKTNLSKLKDIYAGYCGANFGIYGIDFHRNFVMMKEGFTQSTKDTIRFLINR